MTRNRWIVFIVVCAAIVTGLVLTSRQESPEVDTVDARTIETNGVNTDHVYGTSGSKVVLFEYGDFQCPSCGSAFPLVAEIKEEYKDQIAFVFRNFPLSSIHPNALAASTVAEAAGKQDKFFEMHDLLYSQQAAWENASSDSRATIFERYATDLGLDIKKYKADLENKAIKQKIDRDRALARKIGVSGTPTFFVNGKQLESNVWQDGEEFRKELNEALKEAGIAPPSKKTAE